MAIAITAKTRKEQRKEARKKKRKKISSVSTIEPRDEVKNKTSDGKRQKVHGSARDSVRHMASDTKTRSKEKFRKARKDIDRTDQRSSLKIKVSGGSDDVHNAGRIDLDSIDPDVAAALRRDEEEIAELEAKLGLSTTSTKGNGRKEKDRLYKEYSKLEGFGDDFGDFLDDLDQMVVRLKDPSKRSNDYNDDDDESDEDRRKVERRKRSREKNDMIQDVQEADDDDHSSSSGDEEMIPMKDPFHMLDDDDSVLEELERMEKEQILQLNNSKQKERSFERDSQSSKKSHRTDNGENVSEERIHSDDAESEDDSDGGSHNSDDDENDMDSRETKYADAPDHDAADTYRPAIGEDIYGNQIGQSDNPSRPKKYVPPHLRKKQNIDNDDDEKERRSAIRRSLNNALNRLSEDTLISVSKQVAQLYSSNPTKIVDEMIWLNAKDLCIETSVVMSGLIPVYAACIAAIHIQTSDTVQLGESMLEFIVVDLWARLSRIRESTSQTTSSSGSAAIKDIQDDGDSKRICNIILLLGYLYNYQIVHCSFIYDVIRSLINNMCEIDIECLLLLLSHCGGALRSDDPLALKQIVLLVQKKTSGNGDLSSSSRAQYMVSAIMDLKNNRRKKQDTVYAEKTTKIRKIIGRVKSVASKQGMSNTTSETSSRISLEDILNAETKGRWWKVGASWIGNQYRFVDGATDPSASCNDGDKSHGTTLDESKVEENEELLKLAAKFRMNTDRKRSIFCIIMSGSDCEDTFEKLCRSSMLQNRSERDTVRVIMECCGNEKAYNKFYGHLAARICEFQPQSKFSLQLAYWDTFKQLESMTIRRVANLAKLLFHLVATHQTLRLLPIIKPLDFADSDMGEKTSVFVTIVFSSILDYFDNPLSAKALFAKQQNESSIFDDEKEDKEEGVRAGLLIFFIETLKSSPKNKKGSNFKRNFKAVVKALDTSGLY